MTTCGYEYALPIVKINFNGTDISDKEFAELTKFKQGLSRTREIDISFTDLTDISLCELYVFHDIEVLYMAKRKPRMTV